ncbi:MAG: ABC transporter ATP-binding protein [Desulfurispora sp.]|uniref:ABC transporter ATP-binding protein n=1 Tax=Desulfurispora sp. TaxID=3014275 RepID=UPI00404A20B2
MSGLALRNIGKSFKNVEVIKEINLEIADGEFIVLVGPSGCGKSTILRMVAGLEEPSRGQIIIGGRDVTRLEPKDRDIAMVFQDYALYPHMTIAENIAFGLKLRKIPKSELASRVAMAAEILSIQHLLDRYPKQLSGGQRQRVALGRAIVRQPQVFLMDEPLSNLDAKLRVQMRAELVKLQRQLKTTTIYVTHDQVEAMTMGDRIVVLNGGQIQQVGTPDEIYHQPANLFVADFVGSPAMNFIKGTLDKSSVPRFCCDGFTIPLPAAAAGIAEKEVILGVRPENISLRQKTGRRWSEELAGRVVLVEDLGAQKVIFLQMGSQEVTACINDHHLVQAGVGEPVPVYMDLDRLYLFSTAVGQRLL